MKTILIVIAIALALFFGQRYLVNKKKPKKKIIKKKPYTPETIEYTGDNKEFYERVNNHRTGIDRNQVISDRVLTIFAIEFCEYMVKKNTASHDFALKRHDDIRVYGFKKISETSIAWRGGIERTFNTYLRSDEHRETIEGEEYTHYGSHTITVDKKIFNFQIFANR